MQEKIALAPARSKNLSEIASAIGQTRSRSAPPSPSSVSRALNGVTFTGKSDGRGRPRLTDAQSDRRLAAATKRVQRRSMSSEVNAIMIREEWKPTKNGERVNVSPATVSRRQREQGRGWKRCRKKLPLTKAAPTAQSMHAPMLKNVCAFFTCLQS